MSRHSIDRVEFLAVEGWALGADGQPVDVSLWVDGQVLPSELERQPRPDVQSGLGGAVALDSGFVLRVDAAAWWRQAAGRPVRCLLKVQGNAAGEVDVGLSRGEFAAWLEAVAASPASPSREAEWARLQPLLATDAMGQGDLPAWAAARRQQGGLPRPATLLGAVEHVEGLRIIGWVCDCLAGHEAFTVHCHHQAWPVRARRVPRQDVLRAVPQARERAGFEIELPSAIWRATGPTGDAWVQLSVNGHFLLARPRRFARSDLQPAWRAALQWLDARPAPSAEAASHPNDPASQAAAEQAHRQGLVLEHGLAAGLLADEPRASWLRLQRRLGEADAQALVSWLSGAGEDLEAASRPDDDALVAWRLQQEFNDALGQPAAARAPGGADAPTADELRSALQHIRNRHAGVHAKRWQSFLASLVPTFCAADALPMLRPLLSDGHLDFLERHDGRWELSLLLPLRLRDELPGGRLGACVKLLNRLARPEAGGWLNTVAIRDAVSQVHEALSAGRPVDDEDLHRFVAALLTLWRRLADDPLWSRLHDENLLQAQATMLLLRRWLDEPVAEQVWQAALRLYALVPAFWRLLPELPDRVRPLQPVLDDLAHGRAPRDAAAAVQALAWARDQACVEAPSLQRHALLSALARGDADEAWRTGLPLADVLRLALEGDRAEAAWRDVGPAPWPAQVPRRMAAWTAVQALFSGGVSDPERSRNALTDLQAAAGERSGFVGIALLLRVARIVPSGTALADQVAQALTDSIEHGLASCALRHAEHPVPPAALCAAGAGLEQWAGEADAPAWVTALRDRWSVAARALWGVDLMAAATRLPRALAWRTASPGTDVLVVLRLQSHDADAAARAVTPWVEAARQHGGRALQLCVWQAAPGSALASGQVVGLPCVVQPDLLGLLRHLADHSPFAHFHLVDVDTVPAPLAWLSRTGVLSSHYQGPADQTPVTRVRIDAGHLRLHLLPSPAPVARVATGLGVSRQAVGWALARLDDESTPPWMVESTDQEQLLAQLLACAGVPLDSRGQWHFEARPLVGFAALPAPGAGSPTVTTRGRIEGPLAACLAAQTPHGPPRIWPTDRAPSLAGIRGSQQLVRLRDPWAGAPMGEDEVGVFAVARNERVLMPHFLAHYRSLGVRRFTIADNLSDDGTREYLLAQPDVMVYSVDTPYKLSHYGVAWQQAMLAAHAQGRWALVVDIDELLVWPGCESESLAARCARLHAQGHDAALALMVDMYPAGPLDSADFERGAPFAEAPCFDAVPARRWRLGSGSFSNSPSYVSNARHRLLPGSPPNHYTAQKVPLVRYQPFLRWSEGLHYAAGVQRAPEPLFLAHFKYHRGFRAKVEEEVARKQHYNDAEEYRKYLALWTEARGMMFDPAISRRYADSHSFAVIPWN